MARIFRKRLWRKFKLVLTEKREICQCGMPREIIFKSDWDLRDVSDEKLFAAIIPIIAKEIIPLLGEGLIEEAAKLPGVTDLHTELAEFFLHGCGVPRSDCNKLIVFMECPDSIAARYRREQIPIVVTIFAGMLEATADDEPEESNLPFARA